MPVLCKVMRGEFIESIHVAYAVVVDEKGKIIFSTGNPHYLTCIRSSLKPFQAAASVRAGAPDAAQFSEAELALMCASHNGEKIHVQTAGSMLKKLGYTADHYECGKHPPYDKESRIEILRKGSEILPLHNNCSGKHAGMLALAKHLGVDPQGYTRPDHLVQQKIIEAVKEYSGLDSLPLATDGCSAPTPFMTIYTIATLFQKLASGKISELSRLYEVMTKNPYLVAGKERFDTDFITALQGRAVCKVGGDAVRGFGIRKPDGQVLGVAIKILDGHQRATAPAALAVFNHLGLLTDTENGALEKYREPVLKNLRQIEVGKITAGIDG